MIKFTEINYGNNWGIFVDIENAEDSSYNKINYVNKELTITISDSENIDKNENEYIKIINTIFINLFVCGFLAYTIYFVL
jgi:hypothetical protein